MALLKFPAPSSMPSPALHRDARKAGGGKEDGCGKNLCPETPW